MRRVVIAASAGVLLAGPAVLAFWTGGFFDEPRLWATAVAWSLVLVGCVVSPQPLPVSRAGRAALAGLALLTAWTAASIAWAPLAGPATDSAQRLLLYTGALVAAAALLRTPRVARGAEPVLTLGIVVVVGYGLAGRLLPELLHQSRSLSAGGRLEQPLTYWNAMGLLAALGVVLATRLAGDPTRRPALRVAAAAAVAPLAVGLYLSFSRGAMAACVFGLVLLVALAPTWGQLRGAAVSLAMGAAAIAAAAAFPSIATAEGATAARERDGALVLALLLAVGAAGGLWTLARLARERSGRLRLGDLGHSRHLATAALAALVLALGGLIAGGLRERATPSEASGRASAARLTNVASRRYDYWRIAVAHLDDHPLRGLGAGSFRLLWLRDRPVAEGALEVHSLELEVLLELGVIGALGLGLLVGGTASAAARAMGRRPELAAGPAAACGTWLLHATIDWDWQMPAATLPAIVLVGALIAAGEAPTRAAPLPDVAPGRAVAAERPTAVAPV